MTAPGTWLLTGGAGYIGAHIVAALREQGVSVVVLDDLSTGSRDVLPADVPLVEANVLDGDVVRATLREHEVQGVIHLAAKKAAGESVERPLYYYEQNVTATARLLEAMVDTGVGKVVFSSSAATYGTPAASLVTEDYPQAPESPYGESKLVSEWIIRDCAKAHGVGYINLRYFNVAGAGSAALGDRGLSNLVPLVFRAISAGVNPKVFGGDYPTPDGTCIRDYIHVVDLAEAHVAAVARLADGYREETFNVGRGEGVSVREVMDSVSRVLGRDVPYDVVERRPGDPAQVAAVVEAIARTMGWTARLGLDDMVASAWDAWPDKP